MFLLPLLNDFYTAKINVFFILTYNLQTGKLTKKVLLFSLCCDLYSKKNFELLALLFEFWTLTFTANLVTLIYNSVFIFCNKPARFLAAGGCYRKHICTQSKGFHHIAYQAINIFFLTLLICRCSNREGIWFRVFGWQRCWLPLNTRQ